MPIFNFMREKIILVCTGMLMLLTAYTQITSLPVNEQRFNDSLLVILNSKQPDSVKADAGFLLSNFWYRKDAVKGKNYLEQAKSLAKNNPFQQAVYFFYLANLLSITDIEAAEAAYRKADTLLTKFNSKNAYLFLSKVWHNYGVQQQRKDDHRAFADMLLSKAIPYAIKSGDSIYLGKNYFDLGLAFKNVGQNDKVEEYCNKAIEIFRRIHAPDEQVIVTANTAAENYILLNKPDQAKKMLDLSKTLLSPYPQSQYYVSYYTSEAMYYTVRHDPVQALISIDKGIRLAQQLGLTFDEQRLLLQKYYAYVEQKNFNNAEKVLLELLQKKEMNAMAANRLLIYSGMAATYAGMGKKALAYDWLMRYSQLSDSVAETKFKSQVNELEIKYKNAENEKKIAELRAEKDKANFRSRNNRMLNIILAAVIIFLVLLSFLLVLYYSNTKKLSVQREINLQQLLTEAEQKREVQFTRAMLEGEEKERKRLAGELHDGLGGMLAGVKINLSGLINPEMEQQMNTDLNNVILQLDNSVNELRRIARNMMPETLMKLGLEPALKDMCGLMTGQGMKINFQAFEIKHDIPGEIQGIIYRVVQELLTNAVRHAKASEIMVQCSQNENTFFITVEDNGIGFERETAFTANGIGLSNVKSRVDYLKGLMEINTAPGEGTTINIELHVSN